MGGREGGRDGGRRRGRENGREGGREMYMGAERVGVIKCCNAYKSLAPKLR